MPTVSAMSRVAVLFQSIVTWARLTATCTTQVKAVDNSNVLNVSCKTFLKCDKSNVQVADRKIPHNKQQVKLHNSIQNIIQMLVKGTLMLA